MELNRHSNGLLDVLDRHLLVKAIIAAFVAL
jgi:hypothetical protein